MRKTKKLSIVVVAMASLLLGGCATVSTSEERSDSAVYNIYLKAVAADEFKGTYEEWLDSIKGDSGPKGDKGDTGAQGPKGDKGDIGAQGPKGDPGAEGAKGESGSEGPKGDKGDTGAQGPKGDTGNIGATGAQGETGESGKSAYELYVETYGYVGNEEKWLSDLVNGLLATSKTYTINFYNKQTSFPTLVATQTVNHGSKLTAPPVTRENYEFVGWKFRDELWSFTGGIVTEDMNLYGAWKPIYYPVYTRTDLENMDVSKSYRLMNDLDLSEAPWIPIDLTGYTGNGEYMHFDGAGHTIKGLTITEPNLEAYGLFGDFRTSKGMFENIILEDVTINAVSNRVNLYVGGLFGHAKDETYMRNVKVINANINVEQTTEESSYAHVGIVAGHFGNAVEADYIYSSGVITATGKNVQAGGTIGSISTTYMLHFLRNEANVTIDATNTVYLAGVVGFDATLSQYVDVYGLENYGMLSAEEHYETLVFNALRNSRYNF